jgi:hypothetical protein
MKSIKKSTILRFDDDDSDGTIDLPVYKFDNE